MVNIIEEKTRIANIQFEKSVLSILMISSGAYELVSGSLSDRCFHADRHRTIYQAIKSLTEQNRPCTEGFIDGYFRSNPDLYKSIGGDAYIAELYCGSFDDTYNIEFYVAELNRLADHREVESIAKEMILVANDTNQVDVYSAAEALLSKDSTMLGKKKTSFDAEEAGQSLLKRILEKAEQSYNGDSCVGVRFGIQSLDDMIGSVEAGHMCVVAGREGSGKSTLAQGLAIKSLFRYQKSGLFISAEMDKETLIARITSAFGDIPFENIQRGIMYDGFLKQLTEAQAIVNNFKLIIEEKQMPTLSDIRTYIRRAKRKYPDLGFVIVDYIGLIKDPSVKDRRLEMDSVSRNLKAMGKEFNVPMIVLAQLNRDNVKGNRDPKASDLKESGQIEADADQIVLVHPITVHDKAADIYEPTGTTRLIVGKNRHGKKGSVVVKDRLDICRFVNVELLL